MCDPIMAPKRIGENEFKKKKIVKILSGSNHSMILCNGRVYVSGDPDTGVLGRMPCPRRKLKQGLRLEAMAARKVQDIYTGGYHGFLKLEQHSRKTGMTHTCYYSWGLNNWGQLGLGDNNSIHTPMEITTLRNTEIEDITGGEFHTLGLFKDGTMFGCGRNDDGQLAQVDFESYAEIMEKEKKIKSDAEPEKKKPKKKPAKRGRKKKVKEGEEVPNKIIEEHEELDEENAEFDIVSNAIAYPTKINDLEDIVKIFSTGHYAMAFDDQDKAYSWGLGYNYVCGNGKEETVEEPHKVNPLFWRGKVGCLSLGYNHGMFAHADENWEPAGVDYSTFEEYKPRRRSRKNTGLGTLEPSIVAKVPKSQKKGRSKSKPRSKSKSKKSGKFISISGKKTKKSADIEIIDQAVNQNKMVDEVEPAQEQPQPKSKPEIHKNLFRSDPANPLKDESSLKRAAPANLDQSPNPEIQNVPVPKLEAPSSQKKIMTNDHASPLQYSPGVKKSIESQDSGHPNNSEDEIVEKLENNLLEEQLDSPASVPNNGIPRGYAIAQPVAQTQSAEQKPTGEPTGATDATGREMVELENLNEMGG